MNQIQETVMHDTSQPRQNYELHDTTYLRQETLTHVVTKQRQETVTHDTIQPRQNDELHDTAYPRQSRLTNKTVHDTTIRYILLESHVCTCKDTYSVHYKQYIDTINSRNGPILYRTVRLEKKVCSVTLPPTMDADDYDVDDDVMDPDWECTKNANDDSDSNDSNVNNGEIGIVDQEETVETKTSSASDRNESSVL